jgi:ubiquinone/menaquinone biosynthesis C-methylase UbiE
MPRVAPVSTTTVTQPTLPRAQTQARSDQVPAERGDSGASLRLAAVVSPASEETEAVRRVYEREAANYDRNVKLPERLLFSGGRDWVCAQAEGEVLEIAVGTGLNLPHYADGVRLTGIEFVPAMLDIARRRAVQLGRSVDLRLGDAQALEFEDATFDTAVCTLSLCTIPDDRAAVAEVRRVLRPGGRFVVLEHVRSPVRAVRGVQRLLAPALLRLGADHVLREPLEHVRAEGFSIELLERSKLGLVERLVARKPRPG